MHKIFLHLRLVLIMSLCVLACSESGWTQRTTASLQVSVSDNTGAKVSGARAGILNVGTGATQTAMTDATGVLLFPRLAVGQYKLTVEKEGFTSSVQSGITLTVGQAASLNVTLQVGPVSNTVTVTSGVQMVDTRTATSTELVGRRQVEDLPLNGREAVQLIQLAPGTVDLGRNDCFICSQGGVYQSASGQYNGPGPEATVQVNGTQRTQVNYQLDGVSNNDYWVNSSLPFPNPDAIQEFALQSANFSAEYGQAAGAVVSIVSISGTNQFHGSAFEFLRSGGLNANNWFHGPFLNSEPKTLHRNQYGGAVGGPILKNRLFFFGSFQGTPTSENGGGSSVSFVPTAAERTGDFSALLPGTQLKDPVTGAPIPGNQITLNQVAQNLLKYVPLPNTPASGPNAVTFLGPTIRTSDNQFLVKIDYTKGKNQVNGHYFYTHYVEPSVQDKTNILASPSSGEDVKVQTIAVNDTYVQSPTLLFNTTFGLSRQVGGSTSSAPFSWADLGSQIASAPVPEIQLYITGGFNVTTNHQGRFDRGAWTLREDATKISGPHEFHFGGQVLHQSNTLANTYLQAGQLVFTGQLSGNGLADFELGRIGSFTQDGGQYQNGAGTGWSFFVQDNWRATDALTINAGLRWDPSSPYYDRKGRVVCFSPGAPQSTRYPNAPSGLVYGGDKGCPKGGNDSDYGLFGPRIGFAYRVGRNGNGSIRGGFGVYTNPIETADYSRMVSSAPFAPTFSLNNVDITDPYASVGRSNPFPAQYGTTIPGPSATFTLPTSLPTVLSRNFRPGTVESYNLILERGLGKTAVARVAYIGNHGINLSEGILRDLNAAVYIPGNSTEANTQSRRPYQDFGSVYQLQPNAGSTYNGLQASFEKRVSQLTVITSFTWSRSLDNLNGYGGVWTNPHSRSEDYGPTYGDATRNFKFSEVWDVPAPHWENPFTKRLISGWEISSFTTWQDGTTETVYSGYDNSFSAQFADHADYLGGPIQITGHRSHAEQAKEWFNTSAFGPNAIGTFGTASKGQVRDPAYFDTDLAVQKNTMIKDGVQLQLRGEAFNAWNNVNFKFINYYVSSGPGNFGQVTGALDPREIQLSARVTF